MLLWETADLPTVPTSDGPVTYIYGSGHRAVQVGQVGVRVDALLHPLVPSVRIIRGDAPVPKAAEVLLSPVRHRNNGAQGS